MRPAIAFAFVIAGMALIPFVMPGVVPLLTVALSNGFAVLGMIILLRAGQISFGHGLYFALGAYAVAFAMKGGITEITALILLAIMANAVLGTLVGLFVVRYRAIFFAMLNLAFAMVMYSVLVKAYDLAGGSDGLRIPRPSLFGSVMERGPFELALYYIVLGLAVVLGVAVARYLASPLGRALGALKANETRLDYLGTSPQSVLLVGYVISAALAGLAGALLGIVQGIVTPDFAYWVRSGEFVFIAVMGGSGHVVGAFLGAIVYQIVRVYAAAYASGVWQAILGFVLLGIILWLPEGLVGCSRFFREGRKLFPGRRVT